VAGGVILDPKWNIEKRFSWSLGNTTNNKVEEYPLLKDFHLARENQIQHIIIIGDYMNTIRNMIK